MYFVEHFKYYGNRLINESWCKLLMSLIKWVVEKSTRIYPLRSNFCFCCVCTVVILEIYNKKPPVIILNKYEHTDKKYLEGYFYCILSFYSGIIKNGN